MSDNRPVGGLRPTSFSTAETIGNSFSTCCWASTIPEGTTGSAGGNISSGTRIREIEVWQSHLGEVAAANPLNHENGTFSEFFSGLPNLGHNHSWQDLNVTSKQTVAEEPVQRPGRAIGSSREGGG